MNQPLRGTRVIEVSMWAFVPSAGAVLADWGAEVIKVEAPTGDPIRALTFGGVAPVDGIAYSWEMFNRGKRDIALDLNQTGGQEIVHELAATADVFLTSLLPTAREKLRIDDETIREVNPRIIYASGTGQGARGPEARKGGYDAISFWSRGSVSASVTPGGSRTARDAVRRVRRRIERDGVGGRYRRRARARRRGPAKARSSTAPCSAPRCGRCRWRRSAPRSPVSTRCRR